MDCRISLFVALCLPFALAGCTTPDQVRMAPPVPPPSAVTPPPPPPTTVTTNNNQVAQAKKSDPEKIKSKINIMMKAAEATENLSNVGVAKFSAPAGNSDGKTESTVTVDNLDLQKADLRERARKTYQDVLALDAKHVPAYQGLMRIYLKSGDFDRALESINKALQIAPGNVDLLCDQAQCYLCRKEWKQAENSLWNALQVEPENRHIKKQLGFTLAREGEFAKSVEILGSVFHDVPGYAYYMVARVIKDFGQEQQCKDYLRLAIQTNPNLKDARTMLFDLEHPEASQITPVQAVQPVPQISHGVFVTEG